MNPVRPQGFSLCKRCGIRTGAGGTAPLSSCVLSNVAPHMSDVLIYILFAYKCTDSNYEELVNVCRMNEWGGGGVCGRVQ